MVTIWSQTFVDRYGGALDARVVKSFNTIPILNLTEAAPEARNTTLSAEHNFA